MDMATKPLAPARPLVELMKRYGLTAGCIAKFTKLSPSAVASAATQNGRQPCRKTAELIARVFGLRVEEID